LGRYVAMYMWWWPTQKRAKTCSWFLQQFENTVVLRQTFIHFISTSTNYWSECTPCWPVLLQSIELLCVLEPSYSTHLPATSLIVQLAGVSARTVDTSSAGSQTSSMVTGTNGQACYRVQNFGGGWFKTFQLKNAHYHSFQNV
jgi:hypothetical protein